MDHPATDWALTDIGHSVPEHLRIASSDLHVEEFLGYGSSSAVYRATWLCCEVAVKDILFLQDSGASFEAEFPKELEILMRLPHPHVVQLLGFCVEGEPRRLSIVMELLESSLSGVIHRMSSLQRPYPLDGSQAMDIVTKIALGMKFLHSREIVHGGLSTDIILMNVHGEQDFDVKIGGFAFSDYVNNNSPTVSFHGRYDFMMPPETLAGGHSKMRITKAEDVYSFGIISYTVLTGCELPPWDDNATEDEIIQAVVSGLRPAFPPDVDDDLVELIRKCWNGKPENRPSFSEICDTLAEIRASRAEHGVLQKPKTVSTEDDSGAIRWTTHKDDKNNTYKEIATILETLPHHLAINPADVEWRQPIGEGGYSKVYEVNWLGCAFAVKRFPILSASLAEEVQFLTSLQHPHIARLIGLSVDGSDRWIMMERMDTDLQKLINSRKSSSSRPPFNGSEIRELCLKIALGLNFLHSKNMVHRDIKPANVLVHDRRGRFDVKITDFGVSHRIGNPNVANSAGTGLWRAPEILKAKRDEPLTEDHLKKTDVYSFGMTCYGIVTGNALHEHLSKQDVIQKRRPKLPGGLDSDLRELISKCWDDDPEVRPDFGTICHVIARKRPGMVGNGGVVLPRSRGRAFVEFLRRPFTQCSG